MMTRTATTMPTIPKDVKAIAIIAAAALFVKVALASSRVSSKNKNQLESRSTVVVLHYSSV